MTDIDRFLRHLAKREMSANTLRSYRFAVADFGERYGSITTANLLAYKSWLLANRSVATANLRINAINAYLAFVGKGRMRLRTARREAHTYLDGLITDEQYKSLLDHLRAENRLTLYFAVRTMAMTGVRVSELLTLRASHFAAGYADIRGKGGRVRRIYIPASLRSDIARWIADNALAAAPSPWLNRHGKPITAHGIAYMLRRYAKRYGIDPSSVHPHTFRHLFAVKFLERLHDIALLADLMGHASIETTRIYLRKTSQQQAQLLDLLVDW